MDRRACAIDWHSTAVATLGAFLIAGCAAVSGPKLTGTSAKLMAPQNTLFPIAPAASLDSGPLDAGADTNVVDGVNDTTHIPIAAGPLPGVGLCVQPPDKLCAITPGNTTYPTASDCELSPNACGGQNDTCCHERWTGPDGITAADQPQGSLTGGECRADIVDTDSAAPVEEFRIQCSVKGVKDKNGLLVTTNLAGKCFAGPEIGEACGSPADCNETVPPLTSFHVCTSGDEYYCTARAAVKTNPDLSPACGSPCLSAFVQGPPLSGCATPQPATCTISRCKGGERDGQICAPAWNLGCGKGQCDGIGATVSLSGDEMGVYVTKDGITGTQYLLCDYLIDLALPMDVQNGEGWAATNLTKEPWNVCLPPHAEIINLDCLIHEPAAVAERVPLGFYLGTPSEVGPVPCPELSAGALAKEFNYPLPVGGVGPVIGVGGM